MTGTSGTTRAAIAALAILTALFAPLHYADAQPRGQALYDLLGAGPLTSFNGITQIQWLPHGRSWLATRRDSATQRTRLLSVDAATGAQSPLLVPRIADDVEPAFERLVVAGDGTTLLAVTRDRVFRIDGVTNTHRALPLAANALAEARRNRVSWTPDGNGLAWVEGTRVIIADARDGTQRSVEFGGGGAISVQSQLMWSADGGTLAFVRGDASANPTYPFLSGAAEARPQALQLRLRWAGQPLTTLTVQIIDRASGHIRALDLGPDTSATYIPWMQWRDGGRDLLILLGNRRQNAMELVAIDTKEGTKRSIVRESVPAFLDFPARLVVLPGGREVAWPSERTGWRHFYLYDLQTGAMIRPLTTGKWPAGEAIGHDSDGRWVYFTGFRNGPLEERVLRVQVDGTGVHELDGSPGTQSATLGPGARFVALTSSTLTSPTRTELYDASALRVRTVLTTDTQRLDSLRLPPPEIVTVMSADGATTLHGYLYKPADFDASKRYPVLVSFMWSGPHYQRVRNWWTGFPGIGEMQLAQAGFLIWKLDTRGTPNRGQAIGTASFGKIGLFELEDHIASLQQLAAGRPWVDLTRTGVFGDSYGGQLTLHAISRYPRIFKAAVVGSPVTDWRNYYASYAEKYLGFPDIAAGAYTASSPIGGLDSLRTPILLAHGLSDANVVPGHSWRLVNALVTAGKGNILETMFYPDQGHVFSGPSQADYHRRRMEFFTRHLHSPSRGSGSGRDQ